MRSRSSPVTSDLSHKNSVLSLKPNNIALASTAVLSYFIKTHRLQIHQTIRQYFKI